MNRKTLFSILIMIPLIAIMGLSPLYGGDEARIGTAAGVQVQVPVGARGLAMAGADVASVQGLEALYWNPAGLGNFSYKAAANLSTMRIFNDIKINYLGIAAAAGKLGTIGFSIKAFDFGEIPVTTNNDMDGKSGDTFSPTFMTTGLTYAKRVTDVISFGVTAKLILESIQGANATAGALDLGIQYHQLGGISGLSLGVALKNIGTKLQYTGSGMLVQAQDAGSAVTDFRELPTASHNLPATVELGLVYQYNIAESSTLMAAGNFQNENFGSDGFKFGLEYLYSDFVALRGGYLYNQNVDSEAQLFSFTAGLGLMTKVGNTNLGFDYAYRDSQYFDGNNLFQLTIGF